MEVDFWGFGVGRGCFMKKRRAGIFQAAVVIFFKGIYLRAFRMPS